MSELSSNLRPDDVVRLGSALYSGHRHEWPEFVAWDEFRAMAGQNGR